MSAVTRTAAFAMTLLSAAASAQFIQQRLTPSEIARRPVVSAGAGTSGLKAIQTRILAGDPAKPGPYTISIRVPPNTSIAAHTHRDGRSAVVAAGLWHFGYGPIAQRAATKALPPGSFYSEPSDMPHFAWTGPEGATVHISGLGPSDTSYVAATRKPR